MPGVMQTGVGIGEMTGIETAVTTTGTAHATMTGTCAKPA